MIQFRVAWRGSDLFDSIEEEGMTLTARACYLVACELVSSLRRTIEGPVHEPFQYDSWACFDFTNLGQKIRCVVSFQDDNDYSLDVYCPQGFIRGLIGSKAPNPSVKIDSIDAMRKAIEKNARFEILQRGNR